jgi:heme exporter protein D
MTATPHIGFIVASYAATVVIVGILIAWIMLDYRAQRRILADLDKRGVTRRSTPTQAGQPMQEAKEDA